ncbi:hypothetical protein B4119_0899 [Parageobacillus caldoxylosilyticus]|uniref:Uncharacterized protein n=1 Tax=Saccharococcus caldoxylosilyticus TaxID=81408 RepID=A0A150LEV7_9BACL|nr:hypothetical protein B4119_0899 [Parageobacillus caldoxylosilyticus]
MFGPIPVYFIIFILSKQFFDKNSKKSTYFFKNLHGSTVFINMF